MPLKIIGAGFGRTGTDSLKTALEMLGFGPCYHMYEVLPHQDRVDTWQAITWGKTPDWDSIFQDYQATVDWPAAFYWRELSAHFPDAKIILSLRDADKWYASMDKTILQAVRDSTDPEGFATHLLGHLVFDGKFNDRDAVIEAYDRNTSDVQAAFSRDKLLTYQPGDGWEPLCEFLGCAVPDEPYPHKNKPGDFHKNLEKHEKARSES